MIADFWTCLVHLAPIYAVLSILAALAVAWCCWRAPLMEDDQ